MEGAAGAAAEAHLGDDLLAAQQGDVFDEQAHHALALALGDLRVGPEAREVAGQGEDLLLLPLVEQAAVGLAATFVLLLGRGQGAQLGVPVRLQGAGHQAVVGIDLQVAALREPRLIAAALHLLPAQLVGLVGARAQLRLHGKRDLQRERRHRRHEQRADGALLVATVTPLALEVTLAVQAELRSRADEADELRRQQVERARYEAGLAQRRYLQVDPDNRLVAGSLEADWNAKLRTLAAAEEEHERRREADGRLLDERQQEQILALAGDFPRLWADPQVPQRERKRMVRLLVEDVTLLRGEEIVAEVRFRGGACRTLHLPLPLSAAELRKVDAAVVAEVDRLLEDHSDAEIVEILNARGLRPGVAERFSLKILYTLRRAYGLEDRCARLRRQGLLTLEEIAELLGAHPSTVKSWALSGRIPSQVYNDKGQRLYGRPEALAQPCQWCGAPIPARPLLRGGKKWCSQRCGLAAYNSRKRAAREALQEEGAA